MAERLAPIAENVEGALYRSASNTLLPETDKVGFAKPPQDVVAFGTWEKVREVLGHLMEPTEAYPPRWHVTEFPNQEQSETIGNEQG